MLVSNQSLREQLWFNFFRFGALDVPSVFFHFFALDVPARVSEVRAKRGNLRAKLATKNREAILRGGRARKAIFFQCSKKKVANFSRRFSAKIVVLATASVARAYPPSVARVSSSLLNFQKCCELAGVYLGIFGAISKAPEKTRFARSKKFFF